MRRYLLLVAAIVMAAGVAIAVVSPSDAKPPCPGNSCHTTTTSTVPVSTTSVAPSTSTTQAPPTSTTSTTTTVLPVGLAYSADFADPAQFDREFVYDVGNYIDDNLRRTNDLIACCPWVFTPHDTFGDHDMACGNPATTSRTLDNSNSDLRKYFWACLPGGDPTKGHLMTGFDTTGYAVVSFSPNRTFTDVSKVCWDVNATEEGGGKWTNMIIVPEALYQQFAPRMDYVRFDFNTPNAPGGFNIQMVDHPGQYFLGVTDFRGSQFVYNGDQLIDHPGGDVAYTTTDKAARFQHCMENLGGGIARLTVARPDGTVSSFDVATGTAWPSGAVRIIFQDEMYDPPKRDLYDPSHVTWHWDNIEVTTT